MIINLNQTSNPHIYILSNISNITVWKNSIYFVAADSSKTWDLYKYNASSGLKNIGEGVFNSPNGVFMMMF